MKSHKFLVVHVKEENYIIENYVTVMVWAPQNTEPEIVYPGSRIVRGCMGVGTERRKGCHQHALLTDIAPGSDKGSVPAHLPKKWTKCFPELLASNSGSCRICPQLIFLLIEGCHEALITSHLRDELAHSGLRLHTLATTEKTLGQKPWGQVLNVCWDSVRTQKGPLSLWLKSEVQEGMQCDMGQQRHLLKHHGK